MKTQLIKKIVHKIFKEQYDSIEINNIDLEEARLTNPETKEFVKKRENFIGSHIFGEDLGDIGKMYVAFSYGEHFPIYMWYKNKWYENLNPYLDEEGSVNPATEQHKEDMRPTQETTKLTTKQILGLMRQFMTKYNISGLSHKSVDIGEKN